MDLWDLRYRVYRHLADTGLMPSPIMIDEWVGDARSAVALLAAMHEQHLLVLDDAGHINMALPFAATDTGHRVHLGDRSWMANCAWDALAIPVLLGIDARIEATWMDSGDPVNLEVRDGRLNSTRGFVHFAVRARDWWNDIVDT